MAFSRIYIGIDVGKLGGIAIINEAGEVLELHAMPLIGKEYDIHKIADILRGRDIDSCKVVIEDVHSIYGTSAKSNFEFGRGRGILEGIVCALNMRHTMVKPKTWQKEMTDGIPKQFKMSKGKKVNDTKAIALLACRRLFPNQDLRKNERCRVPSDGIIDGLLMAEYCRRRFK